MRYDVTVKRIQIQKVRSEEELVVTVEADSQEQAVEAVERLVDQRSEQIDWWDSDERVKVLDSVEAGTFVDTVEPTDYRGPDVVSASEVLDRP